MEVSFRISLTEVRSSNYYCELISFRYRHFILSREDCAILRPCLRLSTQKFSRKCSFISTVRPTVHTDLSPQRSFSKTLFKLVRNLRLCVLAWIENILKTELFVSDDVTIITWLPWPNFPQTQIQTNQWLHRQPRRCLWFTYVTVLRYVLSHFKENVWNLEKFKSSKCRGTQRETSMKYLLGKVYSF